MTSRRIAIVTDAWHPQINGVVTTLSSLTEKLREAGHEVLVINPLMFKTIPLPMYPEIRIAVNPSKVKKLLKDFNPTNIHIATEGPLGIYARWYCGKYDIAHTTSYHTNFPEFIHEFTKIPPSWIYPVIKWFHNKAGSTLVTTETMKRNLEQRGFENLVVWSRAVDVEVFNPNKADPHVFFEWERPIFINVGRVSPEKNLRAFLDLPLPGTRVVVGDGPATGELMREYPTAKFVGVKKGEELAKYFASADVFVFPSLTDTFGLVMIEAMACGTPVAAFPVTGPIDIIIDGANGSLNEDLLTACFDAQKVDRVAAREYVIDNHCWGRFTQIFLDTLIDL